MTGKLSISLAGRARDAHWTVAPVSSIWDAKSTRLLYGTVAQALTPIFHKGLMHSVDVGDRRDFVLPLFRCLWDFDLLAS